MYTYILLCNQLPVTVGPLVRLFIIIIYCITQTNIIQQYKKYRYMQMVQAKS